MVGIGQSWIDRGPAYFYLQPRLACDAHTWSTLLCELSRKSLVRASKRLQVKKKFWIHRLQTQSRLLLLHCRVSPRPLL